jgi:hypothetical protein
MQNVLQSFPILGFVCAVALGSALGGCAAPKPPDGVELTAEQFKTTIVGKTLKYQSADLPNTVTAVGGYKPDGSLSSQWTQGNHSGAYNGTWKLDGDKVCVTDSAANGGKSDCRTWRKTGANTYAEVNSDGTLHGTNTMQN